MQDLEINKYIYIILKIFQKSGPFISNNLEYKTRATEESKILWQFHNK